MPTSCVFGDRAVGHNGSTVVPTSQAPTLTSQPSMITPDQPKCHYEVLGLALTATEAEIKQAHRKLALQWHPDRQHGNEEEATIVYRRIQEAYEVLSNAQERAWYVILGSFGVGICIDLDNAIPPQS